MIITILALHSCLW